MVILSVGENPTLLKIRTQVLQRSNYTIVSAFSSREAVDCFPKGDFDLVILCHSLSRDEKKKITDYIKSRSPYTPIVLLSSGAAEAYDFGDATVDGAPEELLAAIPQIFQRSLERIPRNQQKAS